jgi:hypothetical protein
MAVICQTGCLVSRRRPTKKQSIPTSSPGRRTSMCRGVAAGRGGWYGAA